MCTRRIELARIYFILNNMLKICIMFRGVIALSAANFSNSETEHKHFYFFHKLLEIFLEGLFHDSSNFVVISLPFN